MGNPVPDGIVKVPLPRHHVAHSARLQGWQPVFHECLDTVDDLRFGKSSQYQLGPLVSERQDGSCGRRIEADRTSHLGIPKPGEVEWGHPRSFDDTHETILPFDRSFVATAPENHNL